MKKNLILTQGFLALVVLAGGVSAKAVLPDDLKPHPQQSQYPSGLEEPNGSEYLHTVKFRHPLEICEKDVSVYIKTSMYASQAAHGSSRGQANSVDQNFTKEVDEYSAKIVDDCRAMVSEAAIKGVSLDKVRLELANLFKALGWKIAVIQGYPTLVDNRNTSLSLAAYDALMRTLRKKLNLANQANTPSGLQAQ